MDDQSRRRIAFVVFDDVLLLDLAGPLGVFEVACEKQRKEEASYDLVTLSARGGSVKTSCGLRIMTAALDDREAENVDTVIIAGGPGSHRAAADPDLLAWLQRTATTARRVCSVCTGAFVLASAGLLRERRAVTHWGSCNLLQARYPEIQVTPDSIYLRDDTVWTSAGATAGIDLALGLLEEDRGHQEAIRVAQRLVVFLKRPGGQAQFSVTLSLQAADDGAFEGLHVWIVEHLGQDLRVEVLAAQVGMSPRTFARVYAERTGRTPAKVVEDLRLEAARRALEETQLCIKQIAVRCGFQDEDRMRRTFRRRLGIGSQDYRSRFATAPVASVPRTG
jgi:transcriptional regulator GlxA family with amidase domain